ncbi:MAG: hypothetical protein WC479_09605 [Candidatus Izemoplasmatales bacterium]|jgi:hypothetical protein
MEAKLVGLSYSGLYLIPTIVPVSHTEGKYTAHQLAPVHSTSGSENAQIASMWLKDEEIDTVIIFDTHWDTRRFKDDLAWRSHFIEHDLTIRFFNKNMLMRAFKYAYETHRAGEIEFEWDQLRGDLYWYYHKLEEDPQRITGGPWSTHVLSFVTALYSLYLLRTADSRQIEMNLSEYLPVRRKLAL